MNIPVEHQFDKGVPIPVSIKGRTNPLSLMEVGDSTTFPISERNNYQSTASRLKKSYGKEFTIRLLVDGECRVWRIK